MAHHPGSGQLVTPRRPIAHAGRRNHSRASLRPLSIRDDKSGAGSTARPVSAAEAAQAQVFEAIFYPELFQLQRRLDLVATDPRMRQEAEELTAAIAELRRLLSAMSARFGQPAQPASTVRRDRFMPAAASRN